MKIIVGGVVEKDGKFLLVKAKVGVPKGLWNLPAGHVENGETIDEATVREVKEETGLDTEIEGLVGNYNKISNIKDRDIVRINFKMKIISGKINPAEDEIEEARWFSLEDIKQTPDEKFAFGTKETILDYMKRGFIKQEFFSKRTDER